MVNKLVGPIHSMMLVLSVQGEEGACTTNIDTRTCIHGSVGSFIKLIFH